MEGIGRCVSSLNASAAHFVSAAKLDAELANPLLCGKLLLERTIKAPAGFFANLYEKTFHLLFLTATITL